jgi:capsular exopolysaccharide synthesis family protein
MIQLLTDEISNITEKLAGVRGRMTAARPFDIPMFRDQRSAIFMKIQEDTRRIAALQVQHVAAKASVELAEREDLRNSPEVLYALDTDLEIRNLKHSKVGLETQYANLLRQFGPNHRTVQSVRTQIEFATERTADLTQTVIEATVGSIKANRQAVLASVQEQLRQLYISLEDSETRLKDNEKALDTLRQLDVEERQLTDAHRRVDEKLRDVRLQKRANVPLVPVAVAVPPVEPSMPKWSIMIPVGIMLGLLVGVGLAFLLELMDRSVKSSDDFARRMDLPVLGMIPHADDLVDDIRDVRMAFITNPNSLLGESFRQLRTGLRFSGPVDRRRSLLVSSSMPEDGRTTVAVNLGAAIARDGMKVLVIDANFRQPAIRKLFPQAPDAGLSSVLSGQSAWQDVLCQVEPNLAVMSSGPLPPNPAELLGSQEMRQLVAELGKHFDQVIFDGAPALIVSDSPILSTVVDATMLVVRVGANTHDVVRRTRSVFDHVGANLIGATLNGVRTASDGDLRRSYDAFYDYHEQLPGK